MFLEYPVSEQKPVCLLSAIFRNFYFSFITWFWEQYKINKNKIPKRCKKWTHRFSLIDWLTGAPTNIIMKSSKQNRTFVIFFFTDYFFWKKSNICAVCAANSVQSSKWETNNRARYPIASKWYATQARPASRRQTEKSNNISHGAISLSHMSNAFIIYILHCIQRSKCVWMNSYIIQMEENAQRHCNL